MALIQEMLPFLTRNNLTEPGIRTQLLFIHPKSVAVFFQTHWPLRHRELFKKVHLIEIFKIHRGGKFSFSKFNFLCQRKNKRERKRLKHIFEPQVKLRQNFARLCGQYMTSSPGSAPPPTFQNDSQGEIHLRSKF